MGAVVSCVSLYSRRPEQLSAANEHQQIESIFRTIGACLMAIVNGIASVLQAIIGAIAGLFDIIISCLTCGRGGGRRRHRGTTSRV